MHEAVVKLWPQVYSGDNLNFACGRYGLSMRLSLFFVAFLGAGCGYAGDPADPSEGDWDRDGFTGVDGDCANEDPAMHPGATDTFGDAVDQNCDGLDGVDADADGFASVASGGDDCDDADAAIKPGGLEVWYDGVDSNCAGDDDYDRDGDGVDSIDYGGEDCDDGSVDIPRTETWNGMDDDCDGCVDEVEARFTFEDDAAGDPMMVVSLLNADPHGLRVGFAETSEGGAGWYGEDCRNGETDCHPMAPQGGTLSVVHDTAEVRFGATTYFDQGRLLGSAAVIWDSVGQCTAFGADADYYATAGCCVQAGW